MTEKESCIFCKLASGEVPSDVLYQDDKTLVALDVDWAVKGHALVIWKQHMLNASELTLEEFLHFSQVYWRVEKALLEVLGLDRAITLKIGSLVPHFHHHIYPISRQHTWPEVKAVIEKPILSPYQPQAGEKEELVAKVRDLLSKNQVPT